MGGRNWRVLAVGACVAALAIAGCGSGQGGDSGASEGGGSGGTIKLGIYPGALLSTLPWVADAEGFYKRNGLDVSLVTFDSGPVLTSALASHSIDLGVNSVDNLANAKKQGVDQTYVTGNFTNMLFTVIARKGLSLPHAGRYPQAIADLKGLKWGVQARGGSTELFLRDMAADAGLDPDKDVTFVGVGGPPAALPALSHGTIDVYIAFDPTQTIAVTKGYAKVVVDMRLGDGPADFRNTDYNGVLGLSSYVDSHSDLVTRFQKAESQASCWMHDPSNLPKLVALLKSKVPSEGLTDAQFTSMVKKNLSIIGSTFRRSSVDKWNEFLEKYHLVDQPLKAADIIAPGMSDKNPEC